jgi:hypothetical protein
MPPRRPGDPGHQANVTGEVSQASPRSSTATGKLDRLRAELAEKRESVVYLQELWSLLFADCEVPALSTSQALVWLKRFDVMIVKLALERTQEWYAEIQSDPATKGTKSFKDILAYATGVMYKMAAEAEKGNDPSSYRPSSYKRRTLQADLEDDDDDI